MTKETIRIVWDEISKDQWTGLLSMVPKSCHMHAWGYGEAIYQHTKMIPRRGVIYRSVTPIGMVQAFQREHLFGALSETKVVRGPQWIEQRATEQEKVQSLALMKLYFSDRLGHSFEILPDMEDTPHNRQIMKSLGFKHLEPGLTTSYLDLTMDLKHIQAGINKEWLKSLKKAEERELNVTFCEDFKSVEWILEKYAKTMRHFKLTGPSSDFIRCFLVHNEKPLFVAKVVVVEPYLAGALIVTHGRSATYLLAWSSEEGVEKNASHLLLWRSVERLQKMGIESLDLGGIDMKNAHGLATLKEGLSVQPRLLVGSYT
jgi:hypothetical protein